MFWNFNQLKWKLFFSFCPTHNHKTHKRNEKAAKILHTERLSQPIHHCMRQKILLLPRKKKMIYRYLKWKRNKQKEKNDNFSLFTRKDRNPSTENRKKKCSNQFWMRQYQECDLFFLSVCFALRDNELHNVIFCHCIIENRFCCWQI